MKDALGDRMKGYELATRVVLPRRTYTIIRVDGRAFHSYLKDAAKPFDHVFMADMDDVMVGMCHEIDGTVFAYRQSDEISLLLTDFGSVHTEPWFGGVIQKMASMSSALASTILSVGRWEGNYALALFDARVFTIPTAVDVANYFVWRQRDCVRNSISMAAQAAFSHKSLYGLNGNQMQEKLWSEAKINWNDYPVGAKRGRVGVKVIVEEPIAYTDKRTGAEIVTIVPRTRWRSMDAPDFVCEPDNWLGHMIPPLPDLKG